MNIRKIIAGIMAFCLMGGVMLNIAEVADNAVITASAEDYTQGTYGQLAYKKYGSYIEISGGDQSATEIVIPSEIEGLPVTSIGSMSFDFCTSLKSVIISNGVTSIGYHAFTGCTGLTEITMPNSLTSIGEGAFFWCTGLTSITIPNSVTDIGSSAFDGCNALASIIIPDSVTSIGFCAFSTTSWLSEKQKENPLVIVNNILIDGKTCSSDIVIPGGVTSIAGGAFSYDKNLTSVTIPGSVISIDIDAFSDCYDLTSVTILNPECEIYDYLSTVVETATIYGYENSTAQAYAEKYGRNFVALDSAPVKGVSTGDIDGNNKIDSNDASLILAEYSLLSTSDTGEFTEDMKKSADINKDGLIDSADASLILSYYGYTSTGGTDTIDKFFES